MARLPGDLLTARQRTYQAKLAGQVAAKVAQNFRTVSPTDVAGQRNFIEASLQLVISANRASARAAREYAVGMSVLEGGGLPDSVQLAEVSPTEAIRTSLRVTGPIALRQKITRVQDDLTTPTGRRAVAVARQQATAGVAGAAVRHALAGGRDTIEEYADKPTSGQRVRGYVRITREDDRVCYFCAMLASRANFLKDSFDYSDQLFEGEGTAKVHDTCRCILRPVYGSKLPDSVLMYRRAWEQFSGGDGTAVNNFRSGWTARPADWDVVAA